MSAVVVPVAKQTLEVLVKQPPKPLSFLGTNFVETERALRETFGDLPIQLNKFEHEQVLKGMVAAAGAGATPYQQILDTLLEYDEIEVRHAT
jgi:hypothetical protein